MMENKLDFAFGKVLGIAGYMYGDIPFMLNAIERLMVCMKETNTLHKVGCEFFRLDFRQLYFDELDKFPRGSLILDMKWGAKKELEKSKDK